ncbi:urease accessory protein UreF [Tepidimonas taiwanensis]|uniref:Urease accessory protein UreF n=1 Tax=Tepidimonas taiwanensis TaxID=307486 RepID=A0A554X3T2_9BURK|nr:urease accessory UreF family protein [Tepidimonas taiwanensis]TSE30497.1 Urease accessory protein UreF [Tepidimonas taiwanensis]UBQ06361.1 urease accessory protein UreF [Tepidimonas taiwanensis]
MTPTATLLPLLWLASPALPVGAFSYSEGLEAAVDDGWVHDERSAGDWIVDQLHLSVARAELPVIARACLAARSGDATALRLLDDWVHHSRESAELRLQTEQIGHGVWAWLEALGARPHPCWPDPTSPTHPVALGMALALQTPADTPLEAALAALAFGWAENAVQAAIKAVPLGQAAGQRILRRLVAEIPDAVAEALRRADDPSPLALQAFTPGLALLSSRHETQYSRLFRS